MAMHKSTFFIAYSQQVSRNPKNQSRRLIRKPQGELYSTTIQGPQAPSSSYAFGSWEKAGLGLCLKCLCPPELSTGSMRGNELLARPIKQLDLNIYIACLKMIHFRNCLFETPTPGIKILKRKHPPVFSNEQMGLIGSSHGLHEAPDCASFHKASNQKFQSVMICKMKSVFLRRFCAAPTPASQPLSLQQGVLQIKCTAQSI